jgi:transcriptional regulator with XRE-family HTH domain
MTTTRRSNQSGTAFERRMILGNNVRVRRKALGLSQERLAQLAGCDRQSINRLENGAYSSSADRLWRVADALGVAMAVLFMTEQEATAARGLLADVERPCLQVVGRPDPAAEPTWRALHEDVRRLLNRPVYAGLRAGDALWLP